MATGAEKDSLENQAGQIKIDSDKLKNGYAVKTFTVDRGRPRERIRMKYLPLSRIISVLEKTGACVRKISSRGRYTIIDYTT